MNRRHQAVHDADLLVQHLGQWRQAVRRARCVRDDFVLRRELVLVDAHDERAIHVLVAGRRNDDFLRAGGDVRAGLRLGGEQAGALDDNIDAQIAPRQLAGVALGADLDAVALHDKVAAIYANLAGELAMRGVVLRQVRIRLGIAEIVDRDDLDLARAVRLVQRAQHHAADTAVAVDRDLYRHDNSPLQVGNADFQLYRRLPALRTIPRRAVPFPRPAPLWPPQRRGIPGESHDAARAVVLPR